jgi:xanthine dehydrogenase YagS FAD-binding subunit
MEHASRDVPEFRAGATDLSERRRSGVSRGAVLDIDPAAAPAGVSALAAGGLRIGALTTVATVAADTAIARDYPALAAAAGGLATPQIRRAATLGGAIAQRNRCWYFRNPDIACLKKGGEGCPAREGNALYAVAFDTAPCVAPHPSTLAAALIAYDARLDTNQRRNVPMVEALGDGRAASRETALASDEMIAAVVLPPPTPGERAAYKRAIGRAHSEWPLVELVVAATFEAGVFAWVRLVAGGVAPVPLRLHGAEAVALGKPASTETFLAAAAASVEGANPLPQSRYKLDLLQGLVRDLLETVAAQNRSG